MREYYGHSRAGADQCDWEKLEDHLQLVTDYAMRFAEKLQATDWAKLLGYWHDLGKYDPRFQDYLLTENGFQAHVEGSSKVNHSTFGGQYAVKQLQGSRQAFGYLLAYCILGHHAGLPDYTDTNPDLKRASSLTNRLKDESAQISLEAIPERVLQQSPPSMPVVQWDPSKSPAKVAFQMAFWTRMLFSCLVDADYLATEAFMSPDRTESRPMQATDWKKLSAALDCMLAEKSHGAETPLGAIRNSILQACREKAECPPGFFSLTVPTGGGKTLSSLAFALKHLQQHGKDRIIYAIPFTSIVEQTASVFRNVFGDESASAVLEHHCNVDPDEELFSSRLATENWDAPLIVTTNVQLLESLFAAKPSRCRKLHRLVNSVIILDEAQTLPVNYLQPCLQALQELVTNYGCTVVLCTATQPAVEARDGFPIGLKNVTEIIPDPAQLAQQMRRVEIESLGPVTPVDLVERLQAHDSFLCIVNYKADAARLYRLLQENGGTAGLYHLSTNLCAEHRFQKLHEIRERLKAGLPCRVISTQLIEAGVDIDFPVVYRALAGLDSIAQAAGRCNREGKRASAMVYVFEPEGEEWSKLRGYQARTAGITQGLMRDQGSPLHRTGWLSTSTIEQYFRQNYWTHNDLWDDKKVLQFFKFTSQNLPDFCFRQAAQAFQLIDDYQIPVFVRHDKAAIRLLEELRVCLQDPDRKNAGLKKRQLLRRLQRYAVGVSPFQLKPMLGQDISILRDLHDQETGYYELVNENCYHPDLGFFAGGSGELGISQTIF